MQQLHLQSLFSFRRFAPADDYLGSPFSFPSASLRPLPSILLGFPLRFPVASSFFRFQARRFRFLPFRFRILSFLFFLSALRRFRLPVAFPTPQPLLSLLLDFPLPCRLVSHPASPVPLIQLSCSFPFALPCFAPTAVPQVLPSSSGSYSLSFRLRPCVRSCRFHPAFAVLPLRSRPFRIFATWPLFLPFPSSSFRLTGASGLPSTLSASSRPLPSLRFPPSLRSPPYPFGSFGSLRSRLGTQFRCSSFHRFMVRLTAAGHVACLPSRVQAFPLASFFQVFPPFRSSSASPPRFRASFSASSALGFGLLGIMIHPEN